MDIKYNELVFPSNVEANKQYNYIARGMTLRDYFAGKALEGWLASFDKDEDPYHEGIARFAYKMADAMLKAREE